jgi:hypothetical protein
MPEQSPPPLHIDAIAASVVRILGTNSRGDLQSGTGYVVAPGIVATCAHVVNDMMASEPILLRFEDGQEAEAERLDTDTELDGALLSFDRKDGSPPALILGGECTWKAAFDGWGFSTYANGGGLALRGIVARPSTKDDQGRRSIELDCEQAAAANGTPMHGFSGSPVVVDGLVIGHVKRFLSDSADRMRPAFGKIYATPSASVHALLGRCRPATAVDRLPPVSLPAAGSEAAHADIDKLKAMLDTSQAERAAKEAFELQAAESLIQLGAPADALLALDKLPPGLRRDQLRALALAKTGSAESLAEAFRVLESLKSAGHRDPETLGILGGRYKDMWRRSGDRDHLRLSHGAYMAAVEADPGNHYTAINAAATALWLEDKVLSRRMAKDVFDRLQVVPRTARDCWHLATEAEALLLQGEHEAANVLYRKACASCDHAPGIVATIQRQLDLHERALGLAHTDLARP